MAVFLCYECQNYIDEDWHGCMAHPTKELELVCEDCYTELEEKNHELNEISSGNAGLSGREEASIG